MVYQSFRSWQFKSQTIIKFQINNVHSKHMKWGPKMNSALIQNYISSLRSKVWGKISKAWNQMVEKLDFSPLQVVKAIKRASIWWGFSFKGLEFGLSIPRAQKLHKCNLHIFWDPWKVETRDFHSWDELKCLLPLEVKEYSCWQWLISSLLECWIKKLKQPTLRSCDKE
jgi:hypothetical protein